MDCARQKQWGPPQHDEAVGCGWVGGGAYFRQAVLARFLGPESFGLEPRPSTGRIARSCFLARVV